MKSPLGKGPAYKAHLVKNRKNDHELCGTVVKDDDSRAVTVAAC